VTVAEVQGGASTFRGAFGTDTNYRALVELSKEEQAPRWSHLFKPSWYWAILRTLRGDPNGKSNHLHGAERNRTPLRAVIGASVSQDDRNSP
jgi:hypothetical protein